MKQSLDKGNIIAVVSVNFCGVPFPKAVGADTLIAQVVTDKGKLLLYGARCQGKHQLIAAYSVAQAEVFNILIDNKGNSENALFLRLLFFDGKTIAPAVADYIRKAQAHNIVDLQYAIV